MARTPAKLAATGLAAACLMALLATGASAGRLSVTNKTFRTIWTSLGIVSGETALARCPVTLEGSFHSSTIRKVPLALLGHVSRAVVNNERCSSGHATVLSETLPWHITYESFVGTLPNITSLALLVVGLALRIEQLGFFCLMRTTVEDPVVLGASVTSGTITRMVFVHEPVSIPAVGAGGFGCPSQRLELEGTGEAFILGSFFTQITVRLI